MNNVEQSYIPYARQWIDEEDIKAVVDVLRSDWITQGPTLRRFEETFADYVGARYAVAVNSGTAALHIACLAAGLGHGDEVITSPITFAATANCSLYVGARPAFVDIDQMTFNIDSKKLQAYLEKKTSTTKAGKQTTRSEAYPRVVLPVHFSGLPCDMPEIYRIAKEFGLIVIEDACHALGAKYKGDGAGDSGRRSKGDGWITVGSCIHSDMTVFSFHPVKHITTGEGGMVTTNDEELYQRLLLFRNHGITRDPDRFVHRSPLSVHRSKRDHGQPPTDNQLRETVNGKRSTENEQRITDNGQPITLPWYYEMQHLGYNYRITDIQCALGMSQLGKIEFFVQRRRDIAKQYSNSLAKLSGFYAQMETEEYRSSYHLYVICLDTHTKVDRNEVANELRRMGIGTQVHYIPVYQHPFYRGMGFADCKCHNAEVFFRHCLSIPMYPAMSDQDVDRVVNALESIDRML